MTSDSDARPAGRVTIALIEQAAENLAHLQERTSLSKTDIVNRAITAYEFLEDQMRGGAEILVRRDGETRIVRFL